MDRTFSLSCEEAVHCSRPSIDVLIASAADCYIPTLASIVLTGANQDGAAGLERIKQHGGMTVVQDQADAEIPTMPEADIAQLNPISSSSWSASAICCSNSTILDNRHPD